MTEMTTALTRQESSTTPAQVLDRQLARKLYDDGQWKNLIRYIAKLYQTATLAKRLYMISRYPVGFAKVTTAVISRSTFSAHMITLG